MNLFSLKTWRGGILGGEGNPILVKESRQAVRNRALLSVFCLLLAGLSLGGYFYLMSAMMRHSYNPGLSMAEMMPGLMFFSMVTWILHMAVAVGSVVTFFRAKGERESGRVDLLYVTTLAPGAIVRGKLGAALAFAGMMVSAGIPFMTVAYLLRGISVVQIALGVLSLVIFAVVANLWAILAGVMPMSGVIKHIFYWGLSGLGSAFLFGAASSAMIMWGMGYGAGGMSATPPWYAWAGGILSMVSIVGVLYAAAVFFLSPGTSNRAKPLRWTLTALATCWLALALVVVVVGGSRGEEWFYISMIVVQILAVVGLLLGLDAEKLSRRIRRAVPSHAAGRAYGALFFNGAYSGMLWAFLVMVTGLLGLLIGWGKGSSVHRMGEFFLLMDGYLLLYALGGQWLVVLIRRRNPRVSPVATFLAFILAAGMLPLLVSGMVMASRSFSEPQVPMLGCFMAGVWQLQGEGFMIVHLLFILAAAALLLMLNRRGIQEWWGELRGLGGAGPVQASPTTEPG